LGCIVNSKGFVKIQIQRCPRVLLNPKPRCFGIQSRFPPVGGNRSRQKSDRGPVQHFLHANCVVRARKAEEPRLRLGGGGHAPMAFMDEFAAFWQRARADGASDWLGTQHLHMHPFRVHGEASPSPSGAEGAPPPPPPLSPCPCPCTRWDPARLSAVKNSSHGVHGRVRRVLAACPRRRCVVQAMQKVANRNARVWKAATSKAARRYMSKIGSLSVWRVGEPIFSRPVGWPRSAALHPRHLPDGPKPWPRFGTGRQIMVLERGTNPKLSRRTCSPQYGLHSC
jgi:hypothetical protein